MIQHFNNIKQILLYVVDSELFRWLFVMCAVVLMAKLIVYIFTK